MEYTPAIQSLYLSAVPFSATQEVTISGFGFGILAKNMLFVFGPTRPCRVLSGADAEFQCQLTRKPPDCSEQTW